MDMEKLRQGLRKLTENRNSIKLLAVIMIIITAFLFYGMKEKNDTITVSEGVPAAKEDAGERKSSSEGILYVDVGGAVARPGVYKMNSGDRVFEAIEKAGGLTKKADTSALNQAEETI
ncbi:SLBB domain-containing protein [Hornefia butyriciproducens]|uniref:SLBB domain-containing protein n=1 Tax=Hornefia butyriciproducens TaxID=2652293 RepID=UPI003F8BAA80